MSLTEFDYTPTDTLRQESRAYLDDGTARQIERDLNMNVSLDDVQGRVQGALAHLAKLTAELVDMLDVVAERTQYDDAAEHRLIDAKEISARVAALRAEVVS